MNLKESINRGNNLMIVAFLGAVALGLIAELVMENEIIDKFDDAIIILFALIAVIWYFSKDNKYSRSYIPIIMVSGVFIVKVIALIIEFDDPASAGDEFGLLLPLLAMIILGIIVWVKTRKDVS